MERYFQQDERWTVMAVTLGHAEQPPYLKQATERVLPAPCLEYKCPVGTACMVAVQQSIIEELPDRADFTPAYLPSGI